MDEKQKAGLMGEVAAARYLRDKGYDILTANFRTRFGEIDIIAADEKYIVFVEVKTRGPRSIARPREFVDAHKRARLVKTAALYLSQTKLPLQPRFDVMEVFVDAETLRVLHLEQIENAFDAG